MAFALIWGLVSCGGVPVSVEGGGEQGGSASPVATWVQPSETPDFVGTSLAEFADVMANSTSVFGTATALSELETEFPMLATVFNQPKTPAMQTAEAYLTETPVPMETPGTLDYRLREVAKKSTLAVVLDLEGDDRSSCNGQVVGKDEESGVLSIGIAMHCFLGADGKPDEVEAIGFSQPGGEFFTIVNSDTSPVEYVVGGNGDIAVVAVGMGDEINKVPYEAASPIWEELDFYGRYLALCFSPQFAEVGVDELKLEVDGLVFAISSDSPGIVFFPAADSLSPGESGCGVVTEDKQGVIRAAGVLVGSILTKGGIYAQMTPYNLNPEMVEEAKEKVIARWDK